MTREQAMVKAFHIMGGAVVNQRPTLISPDLQELRRKLIQEELDELMLAEQTGDLVGIADALADLLYVVYGTGVSHGLDLEPVFNEVHRSNMTKTPCKPGEGAQTHKITKGPSYSPPVLKDILVRQGWKP
jgi:predicted HAD superfamily Cof-like phosphohydrolase